MGWWCAQLRSFFLGIQNLPTGMPSKEYTCPSRRPKRQGFDPSYGKIPWRRNWQRTPVFSPGKFHGQWSLSVYSLWGPKQSDMTEQLSMHENLSTECNRWKSLITALLGSHAQVGRPHQTTPRSLEWSIVACSCPHWCQSLIPQKTFTVTSSTHWWFAHLCVV